MDLVVLGKVSVERTVTAQKEREDGGVVPSKLLLYFLLIIISLFLFQSLDSIPVENQFFHYIYLSKIFNLSML